MEINEVVAKNLIAYRKQRGLTQAELAEMISYSDKSISKWERGECIPDLAILKQLADFYGITINDFLNESGDIKKVKQKRKFKKRHIIVPILSVGLVFLVAILCFVGIMIFAHPIPQKAYLCFIYALPVAAIVLTVLSSVWHLKLLNFFSISGILWFVTLSLFLSFNSTNLWMIFFIPTVLEIMLILWFFLKADIKEKIFSFGTKNKKQKRDEQQKLEQEKVNEEKQKEL